MDIIRLAEAKTLSVTEKALNFLRHGCSFPAFLTQLKQILDGFGVDLAKACLESLDQEEEPPARQSMCRFLTGSVAKDVVSWLP